MKAQRDVVFEADKQKRKNKKNPTSEQNAEKKEAFQVLYMSIILLFPKPSLSLMQYKSPLIKAWAHVKKS